MGNNNKKKNKLYSLFEKEFKIGMFYKPSMEGIDIFYYIILDNMIRLTIRLFDNNVITIHEVVALTDAYIIKYLENFIEFLKNQKEFTVLISKIGHNAHGINEACLKLDIPIVDDTRFLTVPLRVYERMKTTYRNDATKYGFYLLAVSDELNINVTEENNLEINEESEPELIVVEDDIKEDSLLDKFCKFVSNRKKNVSIEKKDSIIKVIFDYVEYIVEERENGIYITDVVDPTSTISSIFYMGFFEYIENFLTEGDIYLDEINNPIVLSICRARMYPKVTTNNRRNSFGTYKIKKLEMIRNI